MPDAIERFWIGRRGSKRLPYVLRLPVEGESRIFLAAREDWPRGADVFCHELEAWPDDAEIIEQVPVEACWRAGAAVHLVLRRRQRRRSLFVWTRGRAGPLIFWRSQTSLHASRPGVRVPAARTSVDALEVAVDVLEPRPWTFAGHAVRTSERRLPAGDYGVLEGDRLVAVVERKSVADLATGASAGELSLTLGDLERVPHAALIVEGRLAQVLKAAQRAGRSTSWLLGTIAALQVAHPRVQWTFAETPRLAQDLAYRWLLAASRDASTPERERALGEPAFQPELLGPELLDARARRDLILREATAGKAWTTREVAARCAVTAATALADLNALVRADALRASGAGRARRYVAAGGDPTR